MYCLVHQQAKAVDWHRQRCQKISRTEDKRSLCPTRATKGDEHLEIPAMINKRKLSAMIDSGAQGNYISPRIVNEERLEWRNKEGPYRLSTVEGNQVDYEDGLVTRETAQLSVCIFGRTENITFDITDIAERQLILGIPWLRNSNPVIDWTTGQLSWDAANQRQVIQEMERRLQQDD